MVEHRLVPARVRSEWSRHRMKGIGSVWAPASQESSHVGHAGVGVVSLKGAPLSLPTISTAAFRTLFTLGRAVRCLLPLGLGGFMHLVVLYGYQGSDNSSEQLQLTDQLVDAALGELAVVARGQPCLVVGDFNVEPSKIPSLPKVCLLGSGLILSIAGLSPWEGSLRLLVSAHGNLILEIVGIFRLGAPCVLRRFCHVVFFLIGGFSLILLFSLGLRRRGGLLLGYL